MTCRTRRQKQHLALSTRLTGNQKKQRAIVLSITFLQPQDAQHRIQSLLQGWGRGFICSVERQPLTSADTGKGFKELNIF